MPTPTFRLATEADLPSVIALHAADEITRGREGHQPELTPGAVAAFQEITADPNNELWVAELDGAVVASWQLTVIPGISRGGLKRAQLEAVFVHADHRSQGIGEQVLNAAFAHAKSRGCAFIQLTSDTRRVAAQRFYGRLGFEASHVGMKKKL